ncbi:hypothetical protein NQZ68_021679 [Dissostichus eleginoides]|nr:hypothetical protein NQZ68_021679 [Dissostichus eleginoides]
MPPPPLLLLQDWLWLNPIPPQAPLITTQRGMHATKGKNLVISSDPSPRYPAQIPSLLASSSHLSGLPLISKYAAM